MAYGLELTHDEQCCSLDYEAKMAYFDFCICIILD
jgi:hypothetical protein